MSDFETVPVGTRAKLARLEDELSQVAPCVFHGDARHDCLQFSGQMPCMTQTEADWLRQIGQGQDREVHQ